MKVYIVFKNQYDENLIVDIFKCEQDAKNKAKVLQSIADKYTNYFVEECDVVEN